MRSHQKREATKATKRKPTRKKLSVYVCVWVWVGYVWVCVSGGGEVVDGENGEQSHRETGCQKHRKLKKPKKKGRKVLQHAMRVN